MKPISNIKSLVLGVVCATFITCSCSVQYSDLETMSVNCPTRDHCDGYSSNLTYEDRSCECDNLCMTYKDCCIDAPARLSSAKRSSQSSRQSARTPQPTGQTREKCLHYGEKDEHTGVYAVSKCSSSWTGPRQVRERCLGHVGLSDPLKAIPVTDTTQSVTYRNLYCAECNKANMATLKSFRFKLACDGLSELTDAQIVGDLTYNRPTDSWGVHRLNALGNETEFVACNITYNVPDYLSHNVRFCRSNIISTCAPYWNRPAIATACDEYMAVVYARDSNHAYRNPHCALCNNKVVDDILCKSVISSRKRPMSFALLLDVNQSDGDQVGMRRVTTPECPSGHKYDPFFKRCRELVCALPGHVVRNGRCVRGWLWPCFFVPTRLCQCT